MLNYRDSSDFSQIILRTNNTQSDHFGLIVAFFEDIERCHRNKKEDSNPKITTNVYLEAARQMLVVRLNNLRVLGNTYFKTKNLDILSPVLNDLLMLYHKLYDFTIPSNHYDECAELKFLLGKNVQLVATSNQNNLKLRFTIMDYFDDHIQTSANYITGIFGIVDRTLKTCFDCYIETDGIKVIKNTTMIKKMQ